MTDIKSLHDKAMNVAERALAAKVHGDGKKAEDSFYEAFELERAAAEMLKNDLSVEPTRSVLYRSAAYLASECGCYQEALRLSELGMAGNPSTPVLSELTKLHDEVGHIIEITKELVRIFINSRQTPDDVRKDLLVVGIPEDRIKYAYAQFREITGRRKFLTPPPMLVTSRRREDDWYPGADLIRDGRCWPALKNYLLNKKKWPQNAIQSIHDASDKIVGWLQSPAAASIKTRGLVVGYVQSGKTANFTAVIAKAADAGYRFFIVLSGTKRSLRSQTQQRLDRELTALNGEIWFSPTSGQDLQSQPTNVNFFLADGSRRTLCVVKKNSTILRNLIQWLKSASPELRNQCPFLIIDDEADEASINTARNQTENSPVEVERTAINNHLVSLLRLLPKSAYIGYTATPFANVLIDPRSPDDLYPGDFIVALPKPEGHFGTEQIFGRARLLEDETDEEFQGLDMVRTVPQDEISLLKPMPYDHSFIPEITPSLRNALCYFWLACAARAARGQENEFSTMLIHTTQLINVHNNTRDVVEKFRLNVMDILHSESSSGLYTAFRTQWEEEQSRVSPQTMDYEPVPFYALQPHLLTSIEQTLVVADNFRSPTRLSYDDKPKIQIAVGGNTLSRGLTLEGLVVSFFVRAANTYDTLLQMGRWFGYRPGYDDLPRIWMTDELQGHFFDLATIEAEIRQDITRYETLGITPREFGVRIRTHPDLGITAPLKMQHIQEASVSYGGEANQTVVFEHRNYEWLHKNLSATDAFVRKLIEKGYQPTEENGHHIFRNVPVVLVTEFLEQYQFDPHNRSLSTRLLTDYIRDQNQYGVLKSWNVVIRGVTAASRDSRRTISLGGINAPLLERARRKFPEEYAHIGVLMSKGDIGADLGMKSQEFSNQVEELGIETLRGQKMPSKGLLLIYPIAKDSKPGKGAKENKVNLDAAEDVIGLAVVMPPAEGASRGAQTYVSVDPTKLARAEFEPDEEEDLEG